MQNSSPNTSFPKDDIPPSQLYPSFANTPTENPTIQNPSFPEAPIPAPSFAPPLFQNCFARTINTINLTQLISENSTSVSYILFSFFLATILVIILIILTAISSNIFAYIISFILYLFLLVSFNRASARRNKTNGKTYEYQFYPTFFTVLFYSTQDQINIPYSAITKIIEGKGNIYLKIDKSIGSPNKNYYEFPKTDFLLGDSKMLMYFIRTNYPTIKYINNSRML